jgi:hypothetical protein
VSHKVRVKRAGCTRPLRYCGAFVAYMHATPACVASAGCPQAPKVAHVELLVAALTPTTA